MVDSFFPFGNTNDPGIPGGPDNLELVRGLGAAINESMPLALLDAASMIAAVAETHPHMPPRRFGHRVSLQDLANGFLETGLRETDALLRVWSAMLDDELLKRRIRAAVERRGHAVPAWLQHIEEIRPVRAISFTEATGENETIFIEIATPIDGFTLAAAIDHASGRLLEDAYVIPLSFAAALTRLAEIDAAATRAATRTELPLAVTRARIEEALQFTDMVMPPVQTDSWPGTGPLLRWMLRQMPSGGPGFELPAWSPEDIELVTTEFLTSAEAQTAPPSAAMHAERLLDFQRSYGTGHPLVWGRGFVERVMCDLYPRKVLADDEFMAAMPEVLRALVRYANGRSGIPVEITREVLELIDACEPEYFTLISEEYLHGGPVADLFGASYEPGFASDFVDGLGLPFEPLAPGDVQRFVLDLLSVEAGGPESLDALDVAPLPHEPLCEEGIPEDVLPRVQEIARLLRDTAEQFFADPEMATVAQRLLARVAENDPVIFRRHGKTATAVAALCWIAGKNNRAFRSTGRAPRTVNALMQRLGLSGSPSQRAQVMLRALGAETQDHSYEITLGDPTLLTSTYRGEIVAQRDRLREELNRI